MELGNKSAFSLPWLLFQFLDPEQQGKKRDHVAADRKGKQQLQSWRLRKPKLQNFCTKHRSLSRADIGHGGHQEKHVKFNWAVLQGVFPVQLGFVLLLVVSPQFKAIHFYM